MIRRYRSVPRFGVDTSAVWQKLNPSIGLSTSLTHYFVGSRERLPVFSEVGEVYLDSCIEIKSIPRNGFMAYYKETRGECNESISTALVGVGPNHHIAAYEYTVGQSADRVDASVAQPFLVFRKSSDGFSV